MAVETMTVAKRRVHHIMTGLVHPKCLARAVRELKRGHRRLVRRQSRQRLRLEPADS